MLESPSVQFELADVEIVTIRKEVIADLLEILDEITCSAMCRQVLSDEGMLDKTLNISQELGKIFGLCPADNAENFNKRFLAAQDRVG